MSSRRRVGRTGLALALTTAALGASAVSASATSLPVAVDSPGTSRGAVVATVRPSDIIFTATAGGPTFGGRGRTGIRWTSWGHGTARGTTVIAMVATRQALDAAYRDCYSATITLSRPERIGRHEVFTRLALSHVRTLRRRVPRLSDGFRLASHGAWGRGYGWTGDHGAGWGVI